MANTKIMPPQTAIRKRQINNKHSAIIARIQEKCKEELRKPALKGVEVSMIGYTSPLTECQG